MKQPTADFFLNGQHFQLRHRQCNKPICKCHEGKPHGPYWYADGNTYVGKSIPDNILVHLVQLDRKQDMLKKHHADLVEQSEHHRDLAEKFDREADQIYALLHGQRVDWKLVASKIKKFFK